MANELGKPLTADAASIRRLHDIATEIKTLADSLGRHKLVDFVDVWPESLDPNESQRMRLPLYLGMTPQDEKLVIDPYFADSVLPLMAQKRQGVQVLVVKNSRNKLLHAVDVARFNAQYGNSLTVRTSDKFHDRFLIIDKTVLIHVGASLNHLGKKCFAFSSMDKSNIPDIVAKI